MKRCICGQSMVEAVVMIAVVVLLITGLVTATVTSIRYGQMSKNRTEAVQIANEGMEIIRTIKDDQWSDIADLDGIYCLDKYNRKLMKVQTGICKNDAEGIFDRTIQFGPQDAACQDPDCKKVTVTVAWMEQKERNVTLSSYLTNWRNR